MHPLVRIVTIAALCRHPLIDYAVSEGAAHMKFLMKLLRWMVMILGGLFLLMVLSLLLDVPGCKRFHRYASYKSLQELTEAEADDIQRVIPFQQDGSNYTAVLVKPCRSLASGPAVLIYDKEGKLIDRNLDVGDYAYRSGRGRNDWKFSPWGRDDVGGKDVGRKVKLVSANANGIHEATNQTGTVGSEARAFRERAESLK